ncbi:DUF309 domain-containing protein [Leptospira langatensis]|uniref:DUF309 domain-containing protein n=1 Tax=Leptospira langatensis TaxID=2484983 RepID=A0A5F1ZX30_9LEPT|nr:DUF309 domain-containing protein [Leptospira langatensis]TGJ98567.1 DUF309 domain-containing protein [Leptospira langatensis]TGL43481.1 DUF309 domain-containing protein [Leptospira langatensis]
MEFDPEIRSILEKIKSGEDANSTFDYAWKEGRRLYLDKRYFELHEVFEFQWKKETGGRRLLLHGWIQLAISLNKIFVKPNMRGARMQAEKSKQKFESLGSTGELSSKGDNWNSEIIVFLNELLSLFSGEESWDIEQISRLSLPKFQADGKEWFAPFVFTIE